MDNQNTFITVCNVVLERKKRKTIVQEGIHFFLKRKNTRFRPADFKPHSMIWPDQLMLRLVFVTEMDRMVARRPNRQDKNLHHHCLFIFAP